MTMAKKQVQVMMVGGVVADGTISICLSALKGCDTVTGVPLKCACYAEVWSCVNFKGIGEA